MRSEIERIVKAAYEARIRNDVDGIVRDFADDVAFSLAGAKSASPVPTAVAGLAAVREVMARLIDGFHFHDAAILDLLVDGDRAAVRWRVRVSAASGGEEIETEIVDLLRIADGKIVSLRQFADTALAARLLAG